MNHTLFASVYVCLPTQYNHLPRQIVTPYKPSEDIEQTPLLLPPTPTSPDQLQTASGYFSHGVASGFASTMGTMSRTNGAGGGAGGGGMQASVDGTAFNFSAAEFSSSNPFASMGGGRSDVMNGGGAGGCFTNANVEDDGYAKVSWEWNCY